MIFWEKVLLNLTGHKVPIAEFTIIANFFDLSLLDSDGLVTIFYTTQHAGGAQF